MNAYRLFKPASGKLSARQVIELVCVIFMVALALLALPRVGQTKGLGGYPAPVANAYPMMPTPLPPTQLKADPGVDNIELTWQPSPSFGLRGYWVYRSTQPDPSGSTSVRVHPEPVTGDRWVDHGLSVALQPGADYYYSLRPVDVIGREGDFSSVSNAAAKGRLRLSLPKLGARQGDSINVPVKIGNADGLVIEQMQIWLTYDATVVTATQVNTTTLLRDYAFDSRIIGNATRGAAVAMVRPAGRKPALFGEATLFEVVFQVQGNVGQTSTLDLPLTFNLNAVVYATSLSSPKMPAIPLILQSSVFTVRSESFLMGDLTPAEAGDGVLDASDVQMAMAIAVDNVAPNERQQQVGDLNGDERINSADAVLIVQRMPTPDNAPAALPQRLRLPARTAAGGDEGSVVSIGATQSAPGGKLSVPVDAAHVQAAAGMDLILNYDATLLDVQGIRTAQLTANFDITYTCRSTQTLKVSLAPLDAQTELSGSGTLFYLDFQIKPNAPSGRRPLTLATVRFNDSLGRDFASSDLQQAVGMRSGTVATFKFYMPLMTRNARP